MPQNPHMAGDDAHARTRVGAVGTTPERPSGRQLGELHGAASCGADTNDWHPDSNDTEPELLAAYAELRESCPVAHSDAYGGFTTLFRYDHVAAAGRDAEAFLSDQPFVERRGSPPFIPLSLNGEDHLFFRRLLAR